MIGKLGRSKAGHDKGRVYVITEEGDTWYMLADGVLKPLSGAKRKNKKHIQPILHLPAEVEEVLAKEPLTDLSVKRAIKLYRAACGEAD